MTPSPSDVGVGVLWARLGGGWVVVGAGVKPARVPVQVPPPAVLKLIFFRFLNP